jgi:hypothetical protein
MPEPQELPSPPPLLPLPISRDLASSSAPNFAPFRDIRHPPTSSRSTQSLDAVPELTIDTEFLYTSPDRLLGLPSSKLLDALLARVLVGGIGRLIFQRSEHQGQILWSQDGIPQSVLPGLTQMSFQGVLDELKRLFQLPPTPIVTHKQAEIERTYQTHYLLLRLQVLPSQFGEEATLQVLRGAALKFHQQQQFTTWTQGALQAALELQRKVSDIQARTYTGKLAPEELSTLLPVLNQLVSTIKVQLDDIQTTISQPAFPDPI